MEDLIKEIRDEFMLEAQDLLEEYQGILNTIDNSITESIFNSIYRIVHTLKGNSKACDFQKFSHTIHEFETYLDSSKNLSKINAKDFVDKNFTFLTELFKAIDFLKDNYEDSYDYSVFKNVLEDNSRKPFRFLIVDDEESLASLLKDVIQDKFEDARIDTFTCSSKAESSLESDKYDLVFSDYNMPILSGMDLLKSMRTGDTNSKTPFILITGYKPPLDDNPEIYENVFFLEKPFEEKRVFYYVHCSLKNIA